MGDPNEMRLGDEISGLNSLNLRDLMKEQDGEEISEVVNEEVSERQRQTMGSILGVRVNGGRRTLWEVIQSEPSEKPRELSTSGSILKNVLRLVARKRDDGEQIKDAEEEEDESSRLLENWGAAERSPAVVDSARHQIAHESVEGTVEVFLVAGSNPAQEQQIMERPRWTALKQKLRLRKFACCGSSWSMEQTNLSSTPVVLQEREDDETSWQRDSLGHEIDPTVQQNSNDNNNSSTSAAGATASDNPEICVDAETAGETPEPNRERRQQLITLFDRAVEPAAEGSDMSVNMNLAAALAAERQLRATQEWETIRSERPSISETQTEMHTTPTTPFRVSLMSLLEEADERSSSRAAVASLFPEECDSNAAATGVEDPLCCVCMVRRKGAAFIPCGHTFCRLCSRELWVSRGACPLCNRYIMEILDIF